VPPMNSSVFHLHFVGIEGKNDRSRFFFDASIDSLDPSGVAGIDFEIVGVFDDLSR